MSVRFWLAVAISSALSASALADGPAKTVPAQAPPAAAVHVTCDFLEISATKGTAERRRISRKMRAISPLAESSVTSARYGLGDRSIVSQLAASRARIASRVARTRCAR